MPHEGLEKAAMEGPKLAKMAKSVIFGQYSSKQQFWRVTIVKQDILWGFIAINPAVSDMVKGDHAIDDP